MRIEFSRSGGCSGAILRTEIDTDKLPADEATKIIGLIGRVMPERIKQSPDRFIYTLKIVATTPEGERVNIVRFNEQSHNELTDYFMQKIHQSINS